MVFSSIEFLFLFMPVAIGAYFVVPRALKNHVLLAASLLFYTWGGGAFVFILAASIAVNYWAGGFAAAAREQGNDRRRAIGVAVGVAANVALLGYFKYANFFVDQLNSVGDALGIGTIAWTNIGLPIGISFFTFQSMSYTIDVAMGRAERLRNPFDFALFVSLFPQLIAGPIVRYHQIADQLRDRRTRIDDVAEGVVRFAHGLVKKVLIADSVAVIADAAFGSNPSDLTTGAAWLGVAAYTVQIYFDFSGYSDMAIGLGRVLGFHFPENFNRPYSALSITDFWRRWHITLSSFFRDYLYVPLGGSRGSTAATYRNLVVVFLLTGLWHGANWTFVAWGAYHGALLIIERVTGQRPTEGASLPWLRRGFVLLLVMIGWVLFRAESLPAAVEYLRAMFTFTGGVGAAVGDVITVKATIALAIGAASVLLPGRFVAGVELQQRVGAVPAVARAALMGLALPYTLMVVASGSFSPFLYFQF
ncbi:MAG: MBOAT family protein [Actinobacteria bacterium]|nr:MBOAT family protein [Actinomycetota bacterium]